MLIASAFVLNGMDAPRQWTVFPWAHASCNQPSDADQLRPVRAHSNADSELLQLPPDAAQGCPVMPQSL